MTVDPVPFIIGVPRSGTTLLRLMLEGSPELAIPPESPFLAEMIRHRRRYETPRFDPDRFIADLESFEALERWSLDREDVEKVVARSSTLEQALTELYRLYASKQQKTRYGDKTIPNVFSIRAIAVFWPQTRFVHLVRDGRDVSAALMEPNLGARSAVVAAAQWKTRVSLARAEGQALADDRYLEVKYEDLVAEPEKELRRICGFLALPFDVAMLDHTQREPISPKLMDPREHRHLAEPVTPHIRNWARDMSPTDVAQIEAVAAEELVAFGYALSGFSLGRGRPIVTKGIGAIAGFRDRSGWNRRRQARQAMSRGPRNASSR